MFNPCSFLFRNTTTQNVQDDPSYNKILFFIFFYFKLGFYFINGEEEKKEGDD